LIQRSIISTIMSWIKIYDVKVGVKSKLISTKGVSVNFESNSAEVKVTSVNVESESAELKF
jgi:hypothetical protein